jgi:hypothetical protein
VDFEEEGYCEEETL